MLSVQSDHDPDGSHSKERGLTKLSVSEKKDGGGRIEQLGGCLVASQGQATTSVMPQSWWVSVMKEDAFTVDQKGHIAAQHWVTNGCSALASIPALGFRVPPASNYLSLPALLSCPVFIGGIPGWGEVSSIKNQVEATIYKHLNDFSSQSTLDAWLWMWAGGW